jgi:hypothetical protein
MNATGNNWTPKDLVNTVTGIVKDTFRTFAVKESRENYEEIATMLLNESITFYQLLGAIKNAIESHDGNVELNDIEEETGMDSITDNVASTVITGINDDVIDEDKIVDELIQEEIMGEETSGTSQVREQVITSRLVEEIIGIPSAGMVMGTLQETGSTSNSDIDTTEVANEGETIERPTVAVEIDIDPENPFARILESFENNGEVDDEVLGKLKKIGEKTASMIETDAEKEAFLKMYNEFLCRDDGIETVSSFGGKKEMLIATIAYKSMKKSCKRIPTKKLYYAAFDLDSRSSYRSQQKIKGMGLD